MNTTIARILPAQVAVPVVLGPIDDLSELLHCFAMEPEEMIAIYVEGDWSFAGEGAVQMEEMFGDLAAQQPDDKTICAIVITGNLNAPDAVLIDRDSDWAPALIVGGNLIARSMCLSGGGTKIVGDLTLQGTLYGHYNHGSLEVGGTTSAAAILSSAFDMTLHGAVRCATIISATGYLNIDAHFNSDTIELALEADFLDDNNNPIDDLIMDAVIEGRSVLRSAAQIGKKPRRTVSKAGRERLAGLEGRAKLGPLLKVDLSNCDLKFVPEAIARFSDATWLSLEDNKITSLPDCMAQLRQLEVLNISGCGLTQLPDWLARLPRLRQLNVEKNDLTGLPGLDGGFASLEELQIGNYSSDSNAHKQWVCQLRLAQFPRLRSFTNNLGVTGSFNASADFDAWYSPTLQHLQFTPEIKGAMPDCLLRMTQLRSLDLQIREGIESSAFGIFSQMTKLEAIQLSYGSPSRAFVSALASALPGVLIRCNAVSYADAADKEVERKVSSLIYHEELDQALLAVNQQIARTDGLWPFIAADDYETPLRQKLKILEKIAGKTLDWPLKRERIGAAAQWASAVLARYASLSVPTVWRLGYDLGVLRVECMITLSWWLIRREQPDMAAATEMLNQAESEVASYLNANHVINPLRAAMKGLRELLA